MDSVHDLRQKSERRNRAPVATGFAALGNDDVDTPRGGFTGLLHGRDLVDHEAAHIVRPLDQVPRIPERQDNDRGPGRQGVGEGAPVKRRHQVIDGEGPTGQCWQTGELPGQILDGPEEGPHTAQPARIGHCRRQLRGGEDAHARLNDGKFDAQQGT
jgi:hypothetical protein